MGLKSKPLAEVRADVDAHLEKLEELVQLNIKISKAVRHELRMIALKDGTQVNVIVRDAIDSYLSRYSDSRIAK